MKVTIMFLPHFFFFNKETLHNFWLTQFFGLHRSKCNIFSLNWLKTYAIFLHSDRQLSWQLYIFERDAQFWYTKLANFHDDLCFWLSDVIFTPRYEIWKFRDDFMAWTRYASFIGWIFCIFRVPYGKTAPIDAAHFLWPQTTKIRKITKSQLTPKFCDSDEILNKSAEKVNSGEEKFSHRFCQEFNSWPPFLIMSWALNQLSYPDSDSTMCLNPWWKTAPVGVCSQRWVCSCNSVCCRNKVQLSAANFPAMTECQTQVCWHNWVCSH